MGSASLLGLPTSPSVLLGGDPAAVSSTLRVLAADITDAGLSDGDFVSYSVLLDGVVTATSPAAGVALEDDAATGDLVASFTDVELPAFTAAQLGERVVTVRWFTGTNPDIGVLLAQSDSATITVRQQPSMHGGHGCSPLPDVLRAYSAIR